MVDGGFQEEAEARAKFDRARLSSTQLSTYFAGSMEMWDIELEVRRRAAVASGDPRGAAAVPEPRVVGGFGETPGLRLSDAPRVGHRARHAADVAPPADPARVGPGRSRRDARARRSRRRRAASGDRPAAPASDRRRVRRRVASGFDADLAGQRAAQALDLEAGGSAAAVSRATSRSPSSASPASIASRRTAQRSVAANRSRSRYSTPSQRLTPMATRTIVVREPRLEQPGIGGARRAADRRRPRECQQDAHLVGDGPRLAFVEAGLAEPGDERAREAQVVVPGEARGRDVGARSERTGPAQRQPASRCARAVGVERVRSRRRRRVRAGRPRPSRQGRPPASVALGASGSAVAGRRSPPSAAGPPIRLDAPSTRSARARTSAAIARASPSTPVAVATAARNAANRRSSSSSCASVAVPSSTAPTRPSAKIARNGAWTGSSWSSRSASSSDGTPPPAESAAPAEPTGPAAPSADLAELPEDLRPVRAERDVEAALPDLAAGAQVLQPGPRVAEDRRTPPGRGAGPAPRPATGAPAASRRSPSCAHTRPNRGSVRSSTRSGCGRGRASARAPSRSSRRGRPRRRCRRRSRGRTAGSRPPPANHARRWRSGKISRSWRATSHGSGRSSRIARRNSMPYFSPKPCDLAVAEHRQPGQRGQHRRHAEVLVALAELLDRGLLVGVAHEVDVALEDLRVELERLLDDLAGSRRCPRRGACA